MRIALPKGRLQTSVIEKLRTCGLDFEPAVTRSLSLRGTVYTEFCLMTQLWATLLKPRDVPTYLAHGVFDVGFTGRDWVEETMATNLEILLDLGFNRVSLVIASRSPDILVNPPKRPLVIATEYEQLARRWALTRGLAHVILRTHGSTEGYADLVDIIFENCETGDTLRANGLTILETICESSTCLVVNTDAYTHPDKRPHIDTLLNRIKEMRRD